MIFERNIRNIFFIFHEQSTSHFKFSCSQFYLELCFALKHKQVYNTTKTWGITGCGSECKRFSGRERTKGNRIQKVRKWRLTIWEDCSRQGRKHQKRDTEVRSERLELTITCSYFETKTRRDCWKSSNMHKFKSIRYRIVRS